MGKALEARTWVRILVLSGIVTALGRSAWAQGEPLPPPLPTQAASAPPDRPGPAPTTVEELAARLRAMEESNRKLAEQLARTNSEHDEQMRLLLEKYGELSKRLNDGAKGVGSNGAVVGASAPPVSQRSIVVPRYPRAGLHRRTARTELSRARIPGFHRIGREEDAARGHVRTGISVRDRGRGVPVSSSPRVADRGTGLESTQPDSRQ